MIEVQGTIKAPTLSTTHTEPEAVVHAGTHDPGVGSYNGSTGPFTNTGNVAQSFGFTIGNQVNCTVTESTILVDNAPTSNPVELAPGKQAYVHVVADLPDIPAGADQGYSFDITSVWS